VGPLVFALTALTSLLLLNYIAKQIDQLVGKGLGASVIAKFFALSLPFTIAMTTPMSVLVATLYAFSRLAAENEVTALKANGVSLARLLVPVLIAASIISVVMIGFNDRVLPASNHVLRQLQGDIARKKPTFGLREQIINQVADRQVYLKAMKLGTDNRMTDVTIYDLTDVMRRRTIYADGSLALRRTSRTSSSRCTTARRWKSRARSPRGSSAPASTGITCGSRGWPTSSR
jgi:lipopolysaccharide export system permease protein